MKLPRILRNSALGSILALTTVAVISAPLLGCPAVNQQSLVTLTNTMTNAVVNVANIEGNPTLAAQLKTDGAAAAVAIANWKNGSAVDDVIQALGIVQDDLNLIPGASQYAPLADIAIATVQSILAMIPPSAVSPSTAAKLAPHRSRAVFLGHPAPTSSSDFKKQWNAAVKVNPQLAPALIK